jgi:hypothetical protein
VRARLGFLCSPKSRHRWTFVVAGLLVSRFLVTPLLLSGLAGLGLVSCGTDAVGVDECLKIERARCEAADLCRLSERAACERYVEVQCLHGFVKSSQPTEKQTNQCTASLGQLAECVEARGRRATTAACKLEVTETAADRACELVEYPYDLRACKFLTPPDESEEGAPDEEEDEKEEKDASESTAEDARTTDAGS